MYLTTDDYASGAEAADRLAIVGKAVEVRVSIPMESLVRPGPRSRVKPITVGAEVVRHGLGLEFTTEGEIVVNGLPWETVVAP